MLGDIVNAVADTIHDIFRWFQTVAPGGLGLILLGLPAYLFFRVRPAKG